MIRLLRKLRLKLANYSKLKIYKSILPYFNMPSKKKQANMDIECGEDCRRCKCSHCGGAFYGLGLIGAIIYYISTATGFWMGVLGVLKAIVWPAFLIFELLKFLGA